MIKKKKIYSAESEFFAECCGIGENSTHETRQAPRSHWASRGYSPSTFLKIVLKAITNVAFSTEIFSEPNCCIKTRTQGSKVFFLKGAFSDLLRGLV